MIRRAKHTQDFTIISNALIRDRRLSPEARAMMIFVLQLPDDWRFSLRGLRKVTGLGQTALRSALNELKRFGYLRITRLPAGEHGGMFAYQYDWYERPLSDDSLPDNGPPSNGKTGDGSPDTENTGVGSSDIGGTGTIISTKEPRTK